MSSSLLFLLIVQCRVSNCRASCGHMTAGGALIGGSARFLSTPMQTINLIWSLLFSVWVFDKLFGVAFPHIAQTQESFAQERTTPNSLSDRLQSIVLWRVSMLKAEVLYFICCSIYLSYNYSNIDTSRVSTLPPNCQLMFSAYLKSAFYCRIWAATK